MAIKTTYMFLLFTFFLTSECVWSKILLHTTQGAVPKENFTYFSLSYSGNIILELNTQEGDADLYISEKLQKPSYEPDRYDLHSATCGKDILFVPKSFIRPVGVGIYGHSSHDFSFYILEVYMATIQDDLTADFEDAERRSESLRNNPILQQQQETTTDEKVKPDKKINTKLKKVLTKSGLWALLEMFEMIFL